MKRQATAQEKTLIIHLYDRKHYTQNIQGTVYIYTDFFLFCLMLVMVVCVFQGIFPFHLSCQIYCHQGVHDFPLLSTTVQQNFLEHIRILYAGPARTEYYVWCHKVLITFKGVKLHIICSVATIKPNEAIIKYVEIQNNQNIW